MSVLEQNLAKAQRNLLEALSHQADQDELYDLYDIFDDAYMAWEKAKEENVG